MNNNGQRKNQKRTRNTLLIYIAMLALIILAATYSRDVYMNKEISYNKFLEMVDDKEISEMNQKLIAEGEKTISNIDARLKNLDNLPKDIYSKSQDDFIRAVDEATKVKDNTTNDFNNLLDEMNKALGINPNAMQNPGTMSNTNKNTNTDTKK